MRFTLNFVGYLYTYEEYANGLMFWCILLII